MCAKACTLHSRRSASPAPQRPSLFLSFSLARHQVPPARCTLREKKHRNSTEHLFQVNKQFAQTFRTRECGSSVPVFWWCFVQTLIMGTSGAPAPQIICTDTLYSLRTPYHVHFLGYITEFFSVYAHSHTLTPPSLQGEYSGAAAAVFGLVHRQALSAGRSGN